MIFHQFFYFMVKHFFRRIFLNTGVFWIKHIPERNGERGSIHPLHHGEIEMKSHELNEAHMVQVVEMQQ